MTGKQEAFLKAMLEESTVTKAAKVAGISRNTAYKYLTEADFQAELNRRRGQCIGDAVRYLQGKLSKCSEELIKIIENPETADQVKINAINAAFSAYKNLGEAAEIQERLAQIEAMLAGMEEGTA